ncbi:P-II family nitrogen regulator [Pseudalkalibacillus hwajinpoensis]|uniref:P-II family nitrogen regulator n=1 Tax=Guptibacillus hwajinpoensis TaxID=208199 RepID=UPI00325B7AC9
MKMIGAIIRPEKLTDTINALKEIGITGFTVNQVVGRGKQKDGKGTYRGRNYKVTLHPKIKLEITLSDNMVQLTMDTIIKAAQTGDDGDGKIYVYPVLQAYNIRTGLPDENIHEENSMEEN